MPRHSTPLARWAFGLMTVVLVLQAAWFCGCAGLNYYPSAEDDRLRKEVETLINADPQVKRIMQGHGAKGTKDEGRLRIYLGYDQWTFSYGYSRPLPKFRSAEERLALNLDEYGRMKDKPLTEEELDVLAASVAAASKEVGVTHKIEFVDQVQKRTTRIVGPKGAWVKMK